MIPQEEIKKRLHEELTASGKSQTEIAQALESSNKAYSNIFRGARCPPSIRLQIFVKFWSLIPPISSVLKNKSRKI